MTMFACDRKRAPPDNVAGYRKGEFNTDLKIRGLQHFILFIALLKAAILYKFEKLHGPFIIVAAALFGILLTLVFA